MFALRRWAEGWVIDLHALGAGGPAAVGMLPAASLPLLAAVMGAFFELDNTAQPPERPDKGHGSGSANFRGNSRVKGVDEEADDEESESATKRVHR